MHLVVLKRNEISLPDTLPPVLRPAYLKQRLAKGTNRKGLQPLPGAGNGPHHHNKDLYANANSTNNSEEANERLLAADETDTSKDDLNASTASGDPAAFTKQHPDHQVVNSGSKPPDSKSQNQNAAAADEQMSEETASIVSSPGRPMPVNFDFQRQEALRRDPTIVQPVAVRLSPESPVIQSSDQDEDDIRSRRKPSRGEVSYEKLWNTRSSKNDFSEDDDDDEHSDHERLNQSGPISLPPHNKDHQQSSPPLPPPRGPGPSAVAAVISNSSVVVGGSKHARSSSLDLNNYYSGVRPPVPPRGGHGVHGYHGAPVPDATTMHSPGGGGSGGPRLGRDGKALQCRIQEYREKNSVVARTINELHQEVSDALEERIALEYQLEQLKSFGEDE